MKITPPDNPPERSQPDNVVRLLNSRVAGRLLERRIPTKTADQNSRLDLEVRNL